MTAIYKTLKFLSLPLFIVAGVILGVIGIIKFWSVWTFKDYNLFKYLNDEG